MFGRRLAVVHKNIMKNKNKCIYSNIIIHNNNNNIPTDKNRCLTYKYRHTANDIYHIFYDRKYKIIIQI